MREIEAQAIGRNERACLMNSLAENFPQRRVQQVRRRMVALRVTPSLAGNDRAGTTELERPAQQADGRGASFDLLHVLDGQPPAVADDFALIGDLSTGLRG